MTESIFESKKLSDIYDEIREVYLSDNRPWILGFSGGKDSTCMVQLVWNAVLALPEIEGKERPLCFRRWWKEAPMKIGAYNIPVTDNTERVTVNALIVPMLGFDIKGYRLGYGAGYYDRTISGMNPRPLLIGVAFEILRLEDIYPRPHDVAMDFIVTEAGIFQVSKQGISRIPSDKCALENS